MPQAKRSPRKVPVTPEKIAEAIAYEQAIAEEATAIRTAAPDGALTAELFMRLYPLLLKPIPEGFIETVTAGDGKPYDSTGVRSVQVQHGRMNNVLTPMWWWEEIEYADGGQVCHVRVTIASEDKILFSREAWGGVREANTKGNTYKGAYTNAAKLAFARVGPGHEVYLGAVDLDPDVSEQMRKAAGKAEKAGQELPPVPTLDAKRVGALSDKIDVVREQLTDEQYEAFLRDFAMKMGEMGVAGVKKVGEALAKLTPAQADALDEWLAGR